MIYVKQIRKRKEEDQPLPLLPLGVHQTHLIVLTKKTKKLRKIYIDNNPLKIIIPKGNKDLIKTSNKVIQITIII
jgi:hypothetical protein